jgi:hypothetical protein
VTSFGIGVSSEGQSKINSSGDENCRPLVGTGCNFLPAMDDTATAADSVAIVRRLVFSKKEFADYRAEIYGAFWR